MNANWLLAFVPIGLMLRWSGASPILVFAASALAIVPLARLMGDATEELATFLGPTIGALLNATLGNAPELIIAAFALRAGLVDMVKASLAGSIIGNLLFGLGLAFFMGGIKYRREQQFDPKAARTTTALLTIASFGLIIPTAAQFSASAAQSICRQSAVVLFLIYLASLVSILINRKAVIGKEGVKANLKERDERFDEVVEGPEVGWSRNKALGILVCVTACLALMSDVLTEAIQPAAVQLKLNPRFAGVFLLALVGNAGELWSAIRFARKDQMDLCVGVTVGAAAQVALLVAPMLVLIGAVVGQHMDLTFSPLELIAIVMAIYLTRNLTYDGESNWLEGLMLIGVYVLFGIAFLNAPRVAPKANAPHVPAEGREFHASPSATASIVPGANPSSRLFT